MSNIKTKKNGCFGCGLCFYICPQNAIIMESNSIGFEYPIVDENKCIECGMCSKNCPQNNKEIYDISYKTYACRFQNEYDVKKVASGGAATALANKFVKDGGVVYGVVYANKYNDCKYIRVDSLEKLEQLKGTKYSQASLYKTIPKIIEDLEGGKKVLFFGTPCYVAAIKHITDKLFKQIFFVELICSGVMGSKLEQEFFNIYREKYNGEIERFVVKDKKHGYKWPYIYIKINNNVISEPLYCSDYNFIYKNVVRECCYSCQYKGKNTKADVTIGDFWGLRSRDRSYYKYGVSAVISRNFRGDKLIDGLDNIILKEERYEKLLEKNPRLETSRKKNKKNDMFINYFERYGLKCTLAKMLNVREKMLIFIKRVCAFLNV